mmetsp:Transcript_56781/g.122741  ORF Transcript_56781/g.122741 Transcript_56781/m.122741 type:complete len:646 (+) Transcript_56781:79-2016(+)
MPALAVLLISIALPLASADSSGNDVPLLLQLSAQRHHQSQKDLPPVEVLVAGSSGAYQNINAHFSELGQQLSSMQQSSAEAVSARKAEYEAALKEQTENNSAVATVNSRLKVDIDGINSRTASLRKHVAEIQKSNSLVRRDLESLQANMTTAVEFAGSSLRDSDDSNVQELGVLVELDKQAAQKSAAELERRRREEILGASSVLQIRSSPSGSEDILGGLEMAFADVRGQEQAAMESLRVSFKAQMKAAIEENARLLSEQSSLQATKRASGKLEERLKIAVEHLEGTQRFLQERSKAVRQYAGHLGEKPIAVSFLQTVETRELPKVSEVIKPSSEVFHELNSQVKTLENRLEEVQRENIASAKSQQEEYNMKLHEQEQKNLAVSKGNAALAKEIEEVKQANQRLLERSEQLQMSSAQVRAELQSMQQNITTAQEFAAASLDNLDDSKAQELQVLAELHERDAAAAAVAAKQHRLDEISSKTSLLSKQIRVQMPAMEKFNITSDSKALVESMSAGLENLARAQEERKETLQRAFQAEFEAGTERFNKLMAEKAELNATRNSVTELHRRLNLAVQHLEETQSQLDERVASFRGFLRHMGEGHSESEQPAAKEVHRRHRDELHKMEAPITSMVNASADAGSWLKRLMR